MIISVKNHKNHLISHYFLLSLPQIIIKTKDMSTSVNKITPDLQAKLDKAREEIHSGLCTTLKSHDDIDNYFARL